MPESCGVEGGAGPGPPSVSHSSVGGGLVFGAAVVVTGRLCVVRVEPAERRRSAP